MDFVALFGLLAHVQQSHAWPRNAVHILHIEAAHYGELPEVLRGDFHIGSAVADAHEPAVHGGQDGAEGGAYHSPDAAYAGEGCGDQGSGGAHAHQSGDVIAVTQQPYGFDHGALLLEAHGVDGALVAAYHFGSMHDFQTGSVVLLPIQAGLQRGFVAGEDEMQVGKGLQGLQSPFHIGLGAVVAAEAVEQNLHHNGFTYARWSFIFSSSKRFHWFCMA